MTNTSSAFDANAIITITVITATVLTTIINVMSRHLLKRLEIRQRRLEQITLHQRDTLESYVQALEEYLLQPSYNTFKHNYFKAYGPALMSVPNNIRRDMEAINSLVLENNFPKAIEKSHSLIAKIADYITKIVR